MRAHTTAEAAATIGCVEEWQAVFLSLFGRRLVFAADEYYLLAGRPFPEAEAYEGFAMHEDGIGMARWLEQRWRGSDGSAAGSPVDAHRGGFFASVDGAPPAGYRAPRSDGEAPMRLGGNRPVGVITGAYGAEVLAPLVAPLALEGVRLVPVANRFFGGNIGVTGLLVGEDIAAALSAEPAGHRYLLPDVCLSNGAFLDGLRPADLPHPVEVVATDGEALREALAAAAPLPALGAVPVLVGPTRR